ncbi:hypothetical protein OsJ_25365 [Oryza sativa Japonica Group]|uniref:Uncharacterized protein n=1 Tax=Oryza sativa subsp. japonica TaxID=39947 RepID=B9FUJ2_ORYSJ|nr:hypothetical protein OsJ_25365 [Oryza sativa Japonica Group]
MWQQAAAHFILGRTRQEQYPGPKFTQYNGPFTTFPAQSGPPESVHKSRCRVASFPSSSVRMTEAPFVPREKLFKQQQYFQNLTKHTYLKGRYDVITSVAIPLALAGTSLFMIGRGVYNMSHGIGKKE